MKPPVQIEIAGNKLSIRSDEGPEYVHQLATYVDTHLRELIGNRRGNNVQRAA
ncbi:MAG: cell division protein ZapA, partial [Nannocystaceae bacterium]